MDLNIRDAEIKDSSAILEIFNYEAENETTVFELRARTQTEQKEWIKKHSGVYSVLVKENEGSESKTIVGYASLSPYRSRPGYKTTAESSVFVRADYRGKGVGNDLMKALIERASKNGFHCLIARIAGPNEASFELHKRLGFELVGIEKEVARKFGKWLDCAVFQKILSS